MTTTLCSRYRLVSALCVVALSVTGAAACGTAATPAADDGKISIGAALNAASNPFFLAEGKGIEAGAAAAGATVSVQFANADVQVQSDQIDAFIRQRVGVIIVDAVDSDGIGPAVLRASQAKIPVVAIDVTAAGAQATVTSDNVQAGRDACRYLIEQIGGTGKIAIVDGSAVSAISDRMAGCQQSITASPGVQVVATQRADLTRDKSLGVATNILTANPDVQGMFGVNDPTAIGIALAAQQKGLPVKVVGVDGAQQLTSLIGDGNIVATSGQDPDKLGRAGVELAMKLARGEPVDSKPTLVPTFLVTAQTQAQYRSWG